MTNYQLPITNDKSLSPLAIGHSFGGRSCPLQTPAAGPGAPFKTQAPTHSHRPTRQTPPMKPLPTQQTRAPEQALEPRNSKPETPNSKLLTPPRHRMITTAHHRRPP